MEFPDPKKYFEAAQALNAGLVSCRLCPRQCGVNRLMGETGFCGAGALAMVNVSQLHFGEEPPISGTRGSGTVFFSGCTMHCLFCQNHQISRGHQGSTAMGAIQLAEIFMGLQEKGAHNINLVTPTPHLVVILKALTLARDMGLKLPIVYNTSGYERVDTLKTLDRMIEIYLPDFKYINEDTAAALSQAEDYPLIIRPAIKEMLEQVGHLQMDEQGVALRGLLVRHLVLPAGKSDSPKLLALLARICGPEVWISLMAQYTPIYRAHEVAGMERQLTTEEYKEAHSALQSLGLNNGFVQQLTASGRKAIPAFKSQDKL